MSMPPQVLRIKRKRTDEPVDSLFIQPNENDSDNKRRTLFKDFVFRRQAQQSTYLPSSSTSIPKILATKPGEEHRARSVHANESTTVRDSSEAAVREKTDEPKTSQTQRRQFHLSQPSQPRSARQRKKEHPAQPTDGVAVLMEGPARREEAVRLDKRQKPTGGQQSPTSGVESPSSSSLKRPRLGAKSVTPTRQIRRQASRSVDPRLQDAMLRYAAEAEHEYETAPTQHNAVDEDVAMQDADDSEYVYDTFIRQSTEPSALDPNGMAISADRVGYLVLGEGDDELWHVYPDDGEESEKDWDSEQDDENAENYYGADYPDDEVELEDEFDEDPYRYRRGGVSDDEEYDLGDDSWSDEEGYDEARRRDVWRYQSDSLRTPASVQSDKSLH